jgi:hypothetical protein
MSSETEVVTLVDRALNKTRKGGTHIIAVNNGPHDFSAHPGFKPLLPDPPEFERLLFQNRNIEVIPVGSQDISAEVARLLLQMAECLLK